MKLGAVPVLQNPGHDDDYQDLYTPVVEVYKNIGYVIFYTVSMIFIAMHLIHGFHSAFQSLGINHKKYNGLIRTLGWLYAILVPLGFAILPIYIYLTQA